MDEDVLIDIVGQGGDLRVWVLPQLQNGHLFLRAIGGDELVPQALALFKAEGRLQRGEVKGHGIGHPPALVVWDVGDDPVAIVPPLGEAGQPVEHPLVVGVEDVGAILVDQDARLVGPVIGVARHVVPALQHQHPAALLRQGPGRDRSGIARAHHQRVKCLFQSCLPPFRAGTASRR